MRQTINRITLPIILTVTLLVARPVSASQQYSIIDLGTLGGAFSAIAAINERGQIVGGSQTASDEFHAYLWQNGVMTDLGTLGGTFSAAVAINELGQVVGDSETASGEFHTFAWRDGVMTELGTLGGTSISGRHINERGQIVGAGSTTGDVETHAVLWTK